MSETKEHGHTEGPPALPGEVWRGEVLQVGGKGSLCAVAPHPDPSSHGTIMRAWQWLPWAESVGKIDKWRERVNEERAQVFAAWAMSERARAEKAEARLADTERELADFRAVARGRL